MDLKKGQVGFSITSTGYANRSKNAECANP